MNLKNVIEILRVKKPDDFVLPTGFKELDNFLDGGFFRKEIVVIGADSGVGKSLISSQIYYNIATQGYKSAYFSLEISNETIVSRLIGQIANIKPAKITKGFLNQDEQKRRYDAEIKLRVWEDQMDLYDDIYYLNEFKKIIKENKYEFVVIDFIQNALSDEKDKYSNLVKLSIELQKLAKECNCCILIDSQLSTDPNKKNFEYKGAGEIKNVCDLGFYLFRNMGDDDLDKDKLVLKLAKNRRGFSGKRFGFQIVTDGALLVPINLPDER